MEQKLWLEEYEKEHAKRLSKATDAAEKERVALERRHAYER